MQYRQLGPSSLTVSAVSFGCMSLGQDEAENTRIVNRAIELGVNLFDTADIYEKGHNEEKIGRILKGRRDQVFIASKVGNRWRPDGSGLDWDAGRDHILQAVEGSLARLGTDRIDLYQLHGGTMEDRIDETIGAFELLQQQGKIRYYGISSIRPAVIGEYVRRSRIVSVMMQYSLLDRRPEQHCLELLRTSGIGMLARGTLARGLLTGKEATGFLGHSAEEVSAAAAAIDRISGPQRSRAQTAVQFVLRNPAVSSAVVGFRTLEQVEDLLGNGGGALIPEQENRLLQRAIRANFYE
ncbi:MAG: aldo/keto reductase [Bacteroidota bacterium]|nr:aldo/keto reductase [Bacteroidota bacterium]